ncbi:MAG: hypothetical protein ACO32Y_07890 [Vulcanococcus sp.]|jgi:hypothetical protein
MDGPLTEQELALLEATLLPALERHHLRLLAHGLRTLQQIAHRDTGEIPPLAAIETWAHAQTALAGDDGFASAFARQLLAAGEQLQRIGQTRGCSALALELNDLIAWAKLEADARLRCSGAG